MIARRETNILVKRNIIKILDDFYEIFHINIILILYDVITLILYDEITITFHVIKFYF